MRWGAAVSSSTQHHIVFSSNSLFDKGDHNTCRFFHWSCRHFWIWLNSYLEFGLLNSMCSIWKDRVYTCRSLITLLFIMKYYMYTLVAYQSHHLTRPSPGDRVSHTAPYNNGMHDACVPRKHNHDLTYLSVINVLIISNEICLHLTNIFN